MSISFLLGKTGESKAARFLEKKGYKICCRNYRQRNGEIDIIAKDGDCWVFVEVKTRSGLGFGTPAESVTYHKIRALRRTAQAYLHAIGQDDAYMRFDVIEVLKNGDGAEIHHIESAF